MKPRVKICGITSVDDARVAVDAGADAIGLVFYEPSPRHVDTTTACAIAHSVGPLVTVVGLFVNASAEAVQRVLAAVPLQVLQFHGDESDEFCRQFQRPFMKAIRMAPELDVSHALQSYPSAVGILLDAFQAGVPGGTGKQFDWCRFPQGSDKNLILAGGLDPSNVAQAIRQARPYGVDVSGGVEHTKGRKCSDKVQQFVALAKTPVA